MEEEEAVTVGRMIVVAGSKDNHRGAAGDVLTVGLEFKMGCV